MSSSLKIGNVALKNPCVLAPMAGVTDLPFRLLCAEQNAGLLSMEMVSAKAISLHNKNAAADVDTEVDENTDGPNVKTVWIENNGKSPVYVRARIMVSGVPESQVQIVTAEPESPEANTLYLVMPNVTVDWEQAPAEPGKKPALDDYYYYKKVLPGKEEGGTTHSTSSLLEKVVVGKTLAEDLQQDNSNFSVTIYHESVLAIGDTPGTSLNDVVTAFNTADGNTTSSTTP